MKYNLENGKRKEIDVKKFLLIIFLTAVMLSAATGIYLNYSGKAVTDISNLNPVTQLQKLFRDSEIQTSSGAIGKDIISAQSSTKENVTLRIMFSGNGSGTANDPYNISNCTLLQEMKNSLSAYYQLVNDINCSDTVNWNSGQGFEPVAVFTGTLRGNNKVIYSLYINRGATDNVGLFGSANTNFNLSNLGLINANITGNNFVGGLIGRSYTTIRFNNIYSTGILKGNSYAGGLVGYTEYDINITNSYSTANVTTISYRAGGLLGSVYSASNINLIINNSYSTGVIKGSNEIGGLVGDAYVNSFISNSHSNATVIGNNSGGLIGYFQSSANLTIIDSYSNGNINGSVSVSDRASGGLVGYVYAGGCIIYSSYSTSNISGNVGSFGGLVGYVSSNAQTKLIMNKSYYNGNINANATRVGGLVGWIQDSGSIINNSYSNGNINGYQNVGGLVGYLQGTTNIIYNSYSNMVINGSTNVGGLVGNNEGNVTNSYWDNESSEKSNMCGTGTCNNTYGKPSVEMKIYFTYVNWNFTNIWCINKSINNKYPYLLGVGIGKGQTTCEIEDEVALGTPKNNSLLRTKDITFVYYLVDTSGASWNCSLVINDNIKLSNSSVTEGKRNFVYSLDDNNYNWSVNCTNTSEYRLSSDIFNFTIYSLITTSFKDPTPADKTNTTNTSVVINISITNAPSLSEFKYNWNGTNYTFGKNKLILFYTGNDTDDTVSLSVSKGIMSLSKKELVLAMNFDNESVFGDSGNKTVDLSIYKNNGNCSGMGIGCNYTDGKYGKSIYFDGANDYINASSDSSLDIPKDLTIAAWVYPASSGELLSIVSTPVVPHAYFLMLHNLIPAAYLGGISNPGSHYANSAILQSAWSHIAFTYNGSDIKFYINGTLDKTITGLSGNINNLPANLEIGARSDYPGTYNFKGSIDELRIWNKTLSENEIKQMYTSDLYKLDANKWIVNINQIDLSAGTYTYYGCANDSAGNQNCTETRYLIILPAPNQKPNITFIKLNATSPYNYTTDNLTLWINASDPENDPIKNITNWYVNNKSWTILNMPFENNTINVSNNTKDYSGYGSNGTIYNAIFNSTGGYDRKGAYKFDGIDDYIDCGSNPVFDNNKTFTVSAWIKPNALQQYAGIVSKVGGGQYSYMLICHNDGTIGSYSLLTAWQYSTNAGISAGNWYHVAWVVDNGVIYYYVNGKQMGSSPFYYVDNPSHNVFIGSWLDIWDFNGVIDEVMIYNESLSFTQIKALYNNRTDLVVSTETSVGDIWYAEVTPNDGYQDGIAVKSNNLTITSGDDFGFNYAVLNSTYGTNYTTENLTAYISYNKTVDLSYNWYKNNNSLTLLNMPFNTEANPARDYSGKGKNGSVKGAIWNSTGGYDGKGAYYFKGSLSISEYISIPLINFSSSDLWSISFRAKKGGENEYGGILGNINLADGNYGVLLHSDRIYFMNSSGSSTNFYPYFDPDTSWHFYTFLFYGNYIELYVDGEYKGTKAIGTGFAANIIGRASSGAQFTFNGAIDDMIIWNTTLKPSQIKQLYNNKTEIITSPMTKTGEVWYAKATPNDGLDDGATQQSNNLTIIDGDHFGFNYDVLNSTYGTNYTTENLTAYTSYNKIIDLSYNWYKNNNSLTLLNMPFNTEANPARDYSGRSANGTVYLAYWDSTGGYDGKGAYNFRGDAFTSEYIIIPWINFSSSDLWSLSFRAKKRSDSINSGILGNINAADADYIVLVHTDNIYFMNSSRASTSFANFNPDTSWHFYTLLFYGNYAELYVDGEYRDTKAIGTGITANVIGRASSGAQFTFNGTIDDIIIWNTTLKPSQIKQLYNNRTEIITSPMTKTGEVWYAKATPNDGLDDGATQQSNNLTIIDGDHFGFNSIILNSTRGTNYTSENLTCYVNYNKNVNFTYNWYKNSSSITLLNMPFSTEANPARDYSGRNANGTAYAAYWNSTGGYDGKGAYYFKGNGYISIPWINFSSSDLWSLSFRAKKDGNNAFGGIIGNKETGDSYDMVLVLTDNIYFMNSSGSNIFFTNFDPNISWNFYTLLFYGNYTELYVDGEYRDTKAIGTGIKINSIGKVSTAATYDYQGYIDDIIIWNTTLKPSQIKQLYNNRTDMITTPMTKAGEVWYAKATPNDGLDDGLTVQSNNVSILESPDFDVPNITLISPANNTFETVSFTIKFYYNISDQSNISNCSLILNGILNQTNTTTVYKNLTNNFTATLKTGQYNWSVRCSDNLGNTGESVVYNLTLQSSSCGNSVVEIGEQCDDGNTDNNDCCNATCQYVNGSNSMTGYWNFDENNGTGINDSIDGLNATIVGANWTTGKIGSALSFDGNDFVNLGNNSKLNFDNNDSWSMVMWIKTGSQDVDDFIISKNLWYLEMWNGYPKFTAYSFWGADWISRATTLTFNDNNWHFLTVTYNGNKNWTGIQLFVDGVNYSANTGLAPLFGSIKNTNNVTIGAADINGNSGFNGKIDEFTIYNKVLSVSEIQNLYTASNSLYGYCQLGNYTPTCGNGIIESGEQCDDGNTNNSDCCNATCQFVTGNNGLLKYWNFDEGNGTQVNDSMDELNSLNFNANWTTGKINSALNFNGSQYVNFSNDPTLNFETTDNLTIAAWIKTSDTTGMIVSRFNNPDPLGWYFYIENGYVYLQFVQNWGFVQRFFRGTTYTYNDNYWHYVVATYSGIGNWSGIKLYVDGAEATAATGGGNPSSSIRNFNNIVIGNSYPGGADNAFVGNIDEVGIYNRVLTSTEINNIYAASNSNYGYCKVGDFAPLCGNGIIESGEQCDDGNTNNSDCCNATCQFVKGNDWMISYWRLDENNGTTVSDSIDKNTGKINGSNWTTGKVNSALLFNGTNSVNIDSNPNLDFERTDKFSYAAWIKTSSSSDQYIFTKGQTKTFYITNGKIGLTLLNFFQSNDLTKWTTEVFNDNNWHYVAVTYNGSSNASGVKFYVDGVEKPGQIVYNTLSATIKNVNGAAIGGRYDNIGGFRGSMDEVAVYNKELNSTEINNIYTASNSNYDYCEVGDFAPMCGNGIIESGEQCDDENTNNSDCCNATCQYTSSNNGLLNYWRFDENNGTQANDSMDGIIGYVNGSNWTTGKVNSALLFNGTNLVNLGNSPKLDFERTDKFSYAVWIKTSSSSDQYIFTKGQTKTFYITNGKIGLTLVNYFQSNDLTKWTTNVFNDNNWHYVVVTYNGSSNASGVKFYVDGVEKPGQVVYNTLSATVKNINNAVIGGRYDYTVGFIGAIDEVAVYNKELNSTEVNDLYLGVNSYYQDYCGISIPNHLPTVDSIKLNATSINNYTTDNLTLWYNTSDQDGDNVTVSIYWFKNQRSYPAIPKNVSYSKVIVDMPFENYTKSSDTYKDYSIYKNDGTVIGAIWNSTGGYDGYGAYEFNKSAQSVIFVNDGINSSLDSITTNLSVELWMKHKGADFDGLFQKGPSGGSGYWEAHLIPGNVIRFIINGNHPADTLESTGLIFNNIWYHLVFTYSSANNINATKIYINGVLNASKNVTGPLLADNNTLGRHSNLTIGRYWGGGGLYEFNGTIDNFKVYNITLSPGQIMDLYKSRVSDVIDSELTDVGDVWYANATPNDGRDDGISVRSNNITIRGDLNPPNTTLIFINSSETRNYTNGTVYCYVNGTDDIASTLTAYYKWYNNSIEIPSLSGSGTINANQIYLVSTLGSKNLTVGDNWTCSVLMNDGFNNETDWHNATIYINNAPPEIRLISPPNNTLNTTSKNIVFYYNVTDIDDELANCSLILNGAINLTNSSAVKNNLLNNFTANLPNGQYNWSVNCTDINKLSGGSVVYNLTISYYIPPNITLISPANNTRNTTSNNITFYYNVTDLDSNIANCSLILNGVINQTNTSAVINASTNNFTATLADGQYNWSVNCTDVDKMTGSSFIYNLTIGNLVGNAPNTTLVLVNSSEPRNYTNGTVYCYANGTDDLSSTLTAYYKWYNNSIEIPSLSGSKTISANQISLVSTLGSKNLTAGDTWTCSVLMNDGYQNETEWNNATIYINNAPPEIRLISPPNNTLNLTSNYIIFYYNASDFDDEIANCSLILNGILNQTNATAVSENDVNNFNVTLADSQYNWSVNCTDIFGYTGASYIYNLTISNLALGPPNTTLIFINSSEPRNYTNGTVYCYANGTDDISSTLTAYYRWYNNSAEIPSLRGNITISANEISLISILGSGNLSVGDNWTCSVIMNDGYQNETKWNNATITIQPIKIYNDYGIYESKIFDAEQKVALLNLTWDETLEGGLNITNITIEVRACNDSLCNEGIYSVSCTNHSFCNLTSLGKSQYFQYRVLFKTSNPFEYTPKLLTESIIIVIQENHAPSKVNLYSPGDGNITYDRLPNLTWYNATDIDGNILTYEVLVSNASDFSEIIANATGIVETENFTSWEINVTLDVDKTYFWKARAKDNELYGEYSDIWNFTVQSSLIISLPVNEVDFGDLYLEESRNTSDNNPYPFLMQNDGNINANIRINATDLWSSVANPNEYYQYMIGVNESNSFEGTMSTTIWNNMSSNTDPDVYDLKWQDESDTAELDILITVPLLEENGTKESDITLSAEPV